LSPFERGSLYRLTSTGDPGLAGPWVLDKLGIPMQELGLSILKRKYRRESRGEKVEERK
jgi:hypothetical protein